MNADERIDERAKMLRTAYYASHGLMQDWDAPEYMEAGRRDWRRLARLTFKLEMEALLEYQPLGCDARTIIRRTYAGLLPVET